jgi:hypothetical protein
MSKGEGLGKAVGWEMAIVPPIARTFFFARSPDAPKTREGRRKRGVGRERASESLANYDCVIFEFVLHGHHGRDGARICVVMPRHDDDWVRSEREIASGASD